MIYRFLFAVLPALIGFGVGFIFAWQLALILLGVTWVIAAWLYESTHKAGLGGVIGILAAIVAVSAAVGLAISFAIVYGLPIDLSRLLRPEALL